MHEHEPAGRFTAERRRRDERHLIAEQTGGRFYFDKANVTPGVSCYSWIRAGFCRRRSQRLVTVFAVKATPAPTAGDDAASR